MCFALLFALHRRCASRRLLCFGYFEKLYCEKSFVGLGAFDSS
jgi:hypothetical protein